jgi:hypothetical protein
MWCVVVVRWCAVLRKRGKFAGFRRPMVNGVCVGKSIRMDFDTTVSMVGIRRHSLISFSTRLEDESNSKEGGL